MESVALNRSLRNSGNAVSIQASDESTVSNARQNRWVWQQVSIKYVRE
jgi:hypothetical protein